MKWNNRNTKSNIPTVMELVEAVEKLFSSSFENTFNSSAGGYMYLEDIIVNTCNNKFERN